MSHWHRIAAGTVAAVALCTGFTSDVSAITEVPQNAEYEILLPMQLHDPFLNQSSLTMRSSRDIEARLVERHGGSWNVVAWSPLADSPRLINGSGIDLNMSVATDAQAETAARLVVDMHADVFGARSSDLAVKYVRRVPGTVVVTFQQMYEGHPVWEGYIDVTMHGEGRVTLMGSNFYRDIDVPATPLISEAEAVQIAKADLPFDPGTDRIDGTPDMIVLPVASSATSATHHLVWRVRVRTEDPLGIWVSHVDAHTREIVWRYNDIHFATFSGTSTSDAAVDTYCNGDANVANGWLDITVSGLGTVTADAAGDWNAGEGGVGQRQVTAALTGPWVAINDVTGPEPEFDAMADAGVSFNVDFNNGNSEDDERDVFNAINDIHDFFETFDPGYSYTNAQLPVNVSSTSGICPCNAFFDGTGINMCDAGGQCANIGEIGGVAHHEMGHGVQQDLLGFQGNQGLGEGNSDVLANLLTQESIIGRGFFAGNCTDGIRNSDNTLQYPDDVVGQGVHNAGRVIAGFNWDAMVDLQNAFGTGTGTGMAAERWHFARKLWPASVTNQLGQVWQTFFADDLPALGGDGDMSNGSPNFATYQQAADNHGYPLVQFDHNAADSRTTEGDVNIVADVLSLVPIDGATVEMTYAIDGGAPTTVAMSPTGNPGEYEATIPGLTLPSEVAYWMQGADVLGNSAVSPVGAPANQHSFDIAPIVEPFEAGDAGWTVNDEGTDNATTGVWDWGNPQSTSAQPEDDHTTAGVNCWVTGRTAGAGDGTNDIDGGSTSLFSSVYNLSGSSFAKLKYFRWYSNNTGSTPNTDIWVAQVRNNNGPWQDVERNQLNQNQWFRAEFDLVAAFGGSLALVEAKFIASDLGQGSLVEACVDDFVIFADLGGVVDVEVGDSPAGIPSAAYLAGAKPNPFNPRTTIRYGINDASKVRLEIYDVRGRVVTTLVDTEQSAGNYAIVWDGRDASGQSVSSGVYYTRLTTDAFVKSEKLTLLK